MGRVLATKNPGTNDLDDGICQPRLSVAIVLLPEFTLLAFAGFIEALRHAADEGDKSRQRYCSWTIVGPNLRPVRASCGVEITPWATFQDPARFDYVVVAGGLLTGHDRIDPAIPEYLKLAAAKGTSLVGLCTGSFVIARAGLMRSRRCCVHWFHLEMFRSEFPDVDATIDELYVEDHGRITCAGGGGAIDLAVELIRRHCGQARAMKSLRQMVVDRAREHDHPQPTVGAEICSETADPLVRRAVLLMEQHLAQPLTVTEIAERLGTNERRVYRAFCASIGVTPASFSRNLRLRHGRWLLRNTRRKVLDIALECGFTDASHFARLYSHLYGTAPSHERKRRAIRGAAMARNGARPILDIGAASGANPRTFGMDERP